MTRNLLIFYFLATTCAGILRTKPSSRVDEVKAVAVGMKTAASGENIQESMQPAISKNIREEVGAELSAGAEKAEGEIEKEDVAKPAADAATPVKGLDSSASASPATQKTVATKMVKGLVTNDAKLLREETEPAFAREIVAQLMQGFGGKSRPVKTKAAVENKDATDLGSTPGAQPTAQPEEVASKEDEDKEEVSVATPTVEQLVVVKKPSSKVGTPAPAKATTAKATTAKPTTATPPSATTAAAAKKTKASVASTTGSAKVPGIPALKRPSAGSSVVPVLVIVVTAVVVALL